MPVLTVYVHVRADHANHHLTRRQSTETIIVETNTYEAREITQGKRQQRIQTLTSLTQMVVVQKCQKGSTVREVSNMIK